MKSSKSQLSKDIRFSNQTQGMTKIWSKQKKLQRGRDFFLSLTVYIQLGTKKVPPLFEIFF